jgi:hypothetical protein
MAGVVMLAKKDGTANVNLPPSSEPNDSTRVMENVITAIRVGALWTTT